MITERKLKQWRRDALRDLQYLSSGSAMIDKYPPVLSIETVESRNQRIIELTGHLLDQYLVSKWCQKNSSKPVNKDTV